MLKIRKHVLVIFVAAFAVSFAGCKRNDQGEGPAEQTGKTITGLLRGLQKRPGELWKEPGRRSKIMERRQKMLRQRNEKNRARDRRHPRAAESRSERLR